MSTTHFGDKTVKIRKAVRCWGCGDKYQKGSILVVSKGVFDNHFYSCYYCPICKTYQKSPLFDWRDYPDGLSESDFMADPDYIKFREKYIEKYDKTGVLA